MNILTVDIGNTATKGSIFRHGEMLESILLEERDPAGLLPLVQRHDPRGAICCCVGGDASQFAAELERLSGLHVMLLEAETPLPVEIRYGSRPTLGLDRIAAAVGADRLRISGSDAWAALVVDVGTAMTLDIVTPGCFLGGNISPGMRLRFRSLNRFTSRLPLVPPDGPLPRFGHDTATAIRAGVVRGIVAEIHDTFEAARREFADIQLLLTGGDADFLLPLLQQAGLNPIEVNTLVGAGLEKIYLYNHPLP